jgi:hypothetical protein
MVSMESITYLSPMSPHVLYSSLLYTPILLPSVISSINYDRFTVCSPTRCYIPPS